MVNQAILLKNIQKNKCEIADKCYEKEYKSDVKFFL